MSDEAQKPFEATPARVERAKRDGDVARSSELAANAAFACAAIAVAAACAPLRATAQAAIVAVAQGARAGPASAAIVALGLVPVAAAAAGAVCAGAMQSGLRVTPLQLKLSRLDPVAGGKRIFSRDTSAHALRAGAAFATAALALVPIVASAIAAMLHAAGPAAVAGAAWRASQRAAFAACAIGSAFALAEYAAARGAWLRRLRMSFEERKREVKEQDGDPLARGRRRALHRSFLRGRLEDVAGASFVVVNPVHVAVALEYRPPGIDVPRVTVRASGHVAVRAREIARRHGVPIVENPWLARELYRDARVGRPIGVAHYVAVAAVVAALREPA